MTEETLFELALNAPRAERQALLDRICRGNPNLRARVEKLLASHESPQAAVDALPDLPETLDIPRQPQDRVDQTIGPYRLLQKLGEGGMGAVWVAEQSQPVKRRVALKLIKAGMDSARIAARFEAERQALALMDHTGIAKVLDAGTTVDGRPYFAMELVKGVPITQYCDAVHAGIRDRLSLFVDVCSAVQHAHTKGIVHRDLKPSNVLVAMQDGKPVAKVIDFGVAKALHQKLADRTLHTEIGQVIGTLEYMAPEQAELSAMDIDTRADVYALGVLLYEMLSGSTPITRARLQSAGMAEILRVIKEEEPPKPSTRLSTSKETLASLAAQRRVEPGKLLATLKGELDWIVLKALEKDRTRRYETANGFAADVRRYLENEPILARPPSAAYRLRKSWQRNKMAFAAAAGVAVSMVAGTAISTWQAVRADRETRRVAAILDELQATAPAFAEQARALAAKEQFAEAVDKLDYAAKLKPEEAEYWLSKGDLLQCQFRLTEAGEAYRGAALRRPDDERAKEGARLCDELASAPRGPDGKLSRESLSKLHATMQRQQRPAAELMPVARLLGKENNLLRAYWLDRLKGLPVAGELPLAERLKVRDDGKLRLDLSDTKVADLSPLASMPLASLLLTNATEVASLEPLRGMNLRALEVSGTKVTDLGPLQGMSTLAVFIALNGVPIADLGPLKGLRLTVLKLERCPVRDLEPLRGAPLIELSLRETRVTDLAPLVGMPLKSLDLTRTPVLDFRPLAGLPLENLYFQHNRVTDLGFVRGMPLRELALWECFDARNYEALTGLQQLELLLLHRNFRELPAEELRSIAKLRVLPKLRQLGATITDRMGFSGTGPKDQFWRDWDDNELRFGPLRRAGIAYQWNQREGGGFTLSITDQKLTDLSLLSGFSTSDLVELRVIDCQVSDLRPLRDVPARIMALHGNPIADLTPLAGLNKLEHLELNDTPVTNLSPLAGMPLKTLSLADCHRVQDVSVLAKLPSLENLTIPAQVQNIEQLRSLPNLKRLAHGNLDETPQWPVTTAAEFWSQFEATKPLRELAASPDIVIKRLRQLPDGMWHLDLDGAAIRDLSVLKGAPLAELFVHSTQVDDLTPLKGMKLRGLHLFNTRVVDLRPLAGMPLAYLNLVYTAVSDISPLAGMPLTELKLNGCGKLTDVSPLKQCPSLQSLTLPDGAHDFEFLRKLPKLDRLSFREDENNGWRPTQAANEFWSDWDDHGRALSSWRRAGLDYSWERAPDGFWKVTMLNVPVADLEPIRRLNHPRLRHLRIIGGKVSDLSPLRGMNFHSLVLARNPITDISPIRGMESLQELSLDGCNVKDVAPIKGLPIKKLLLNDCAELSDVGPLEQVPSLEKVTVPRQAKNVERLRRLPNLKLLAYNIASVAPWDPETTAQEFWLEHDATAEELIRHLTAVSAKNPKDSFVIMRIAALEAWLGREADPAATCARAFAEAKNTSDPMIAERWAKARILWSGADKERIAGSLSLARRAVELGTGSKFLPYYQMALGMTEYRVGRYPEAEAVLAEAAKSNTFADVDATTAFFRAMCQYRMGKPDEARRLAAVGVSKMRPLPKDPSRPFADHSLDDVVAALAYKEAKALIEFDEVPKPRGAK
jgi:serine/threonine protein kinase/Leucine-rich repeat (LRR) protein